MKNLAPALVAAGVAFLVAGGLRFLAPADAASPESDIRQATPSASPGVAEPRQAPAAAQLDVGPLLARLEALEERLGGMEGRLARLDDARRPVEMPFDDTGAERLAAEGDMDPTDPKSREYVLAILEEERAARDAEREAQRQQQREEATLERVRRLAEELGLNDREQEDVYSVLLEESQRRGALFDQMRNGAGFTSRDQIRNEMRAIGDWRLEELTARLGPDLASEVDASSGGGRFGGGGGGRGRDGGGRGGDPRGGAGGAPGGGGGDRGPGNR